MINVNLIYPIGSIYISINSKNPSEIFGGTWERIKGKMLIGVDEDDTDFNASSKMGGEKEVTLTTNEIPYMEAEIYDTLDNKLNTGYNGGAANTNIISTTASENMGRNLKAKFNGGGQPHNNLPPYYTVYIFVRTA